jgi:hypothetical protein
MARKKKNKPEAEAEAKPEAEAPKCEEKSSQAVDKSHDLAQNDLKNHPKFSKFKS